MWLTMFVHGVCVFNVCVYVLVCLYIYTRIYVKADSVTKNGAYLPMTVGPTTNSKQTANFFTVTMFYKRGLLYKACGSFQRHGLKISGPVIRPPVINNKKR